MRPLSGMVILACQVPVPITSDLGVPMTGGAPMLPRLTDGECQGTHVIKRRGGFICKRME